MSFENEKKWIKQDPGKPAIYEEGDLNMEKEKIKKIALITVTQVDLAVKILSGALKQYNKENKRGGIQFEVAKFNLLKSDHKDAFTEGEINELILKLKEYDFIGISAVGYMFDERVIPLIKEIKKKLPLIPIILGGDNAVLNPDMCWKTGADAVCYGEGEIDLPILLENWDKRFDPAVRQRIKNFILESDDLEEMELMKRPRMSTKELDQYTPDFSFDDFYVLREGKLIEASSNNLPEVIQHQIPQNENVLVYAFTRGCPHGCEYCYFRNLIDRWGKIFKSKSIEKAVAELKMGKEELEKEIRKQAFEGKEKGPDPFLVLMNSDTSAMSIKDIKKFGDLYRKEVGLPFYCMCSPSTLTPEKIRILSDAGMIHLNIGIQTNEHSNRTFFGRVQSDKKVIELTHIVQDLRKKDGREIKLFCDFIIHTPFENREDIRRTIHLIKEMAIPFDYIPHTLFLGFESRLRQRYEKEKEMRESSDQKMDKLLEDGKELGYSNFHDTYRFYSWLKDNDGFVINTICEFMAGQHNEEWMGRIPRHTKDLTGWDVFSKDNLISTAIKESGKISDKSERFRYMKDKEMDIQAFLNFIGGKLSDSRKDDLSIDFLTNDEVLTFFEDHKNLFINIALTLKDLHPQRYSNESEDKKPYEAEYEDNKNILDF